MSLIDFVFKLFPTKEFLLGKGKVIRCSLIEIKWLFSIYLHKIETIEQDRFHTHAFDALVFIIKGGYEDEIKMGIGPHKPVILKKFKKGNVRWIPQSLNHRLKRAEPGTISLLFTGRYSKIWTEETDEGILRILTSGRNPLGEIKMN